MRPHLKKLGSGRDSIIYSAPATGTQPQSVSIDSSTSSTIPLSNLEPDAQIANQSRYPTNSFDCEIQTTRRRTINPVPRKQPEPPLSPKPPHDRNYGRRKDPGAPHQAAQRADVRLNLSPVPFLYLRSKYLTPPKIVSMKSPRSRSTSSPPVPSPSSRPLCARTRRFSSRSAAVARCLPASRPSIDT